MIACCGLNCEGCEIFMAAADPEKAGELAEEWKAGGWSKACPEWFKCRGCNGPDGLVWSDECKIRACCKGRNLDHCGCCDTFPCEHVLSFESEGGTHAAAVSKLRSLKQE